MEASIEDDLEESNNKFIIFQLGDNSFAAKLTEVREVVELPKIKQVPNTSTSFIGVCNLRGQIIGVVDLSKKLEIITPEFERPVLLVLDTESGPLSCIVDKINSVSIIEDNQIQKPPKAMESISRQYIFGVGKLNDNLVSLIRLNDLLSQEDIANIQITTNTDLKGVSN